MPVERSKRIEQLYHEARQRDLRERAAFLERACAGDSALRREVESLLAEDDTVRSFLETPALEFVQKMSGDDGSQSLVGRQLGSYSILSFLAKGGMGEVYRARDTKLKRDVAIKILPEEFSRDPERLARFQREAEVLAALNHPNIAQIYGLEGAGTLRCIVMELVEGKTLEERLKRGPIPVEQALAIAEQMAEALEAAHERDIIHRDLKPANVKITPEGRVKVLDFGLAKLLVERNQDFSMTATDAGVILGTVAYMSPQQARGEKVDERDDMWAFGCVLYEMLTGRAPFQGKTFSEILAEILKADPDWQRLPAEIPEAIRRLLRRCLQKDRSRRLKSADAARIEIEEAANEPIPLGPGVGRAARRRGVTALVAVLLILVVTAPLIVWRLRQPSPAQNVKRFVVTASADITLPLADAVGQSSLISITRDGKRIVFLGTDRTTNTQLYTRSMDSLDIKPVAGTEGAGVPFLSPDGQWVAFGAAGKLQKVSVNGGPPIVLCSASGANTYGGGTWLDDDAIIFAQQDGLFRVPAAGGTPQLLIKADSEGRPIWPVMLPGGKALLFNLLKFGSRSRLVVQSLDTGARRVLAEDGGNAFYSPTGHILYPRGGVLMALPFDVDRLMPRGSPFPVLEDLAMGDRSGTGHYAASNSGEIVYLRGSTNNTKSELVWVDRNGVAQSLPIGTHYLEEPRLSPDGQQIALRIQDLNKVDVWIHQIARGTLTRFTINDDFDETPLWSPDSKRIAYASQESGKLFILMKPADGSGKEEQIAVAPSTTTHLNTWSSDGRIIAFSDYGGSTSGDIWTLTLGNREPKLFLKTPFSEQSPAFSPDGRWLAYTSNESGQYEVYVVPFPGPGGRWQVSVDGGAEPLWSHDGKELFYRNADKMMAVAVETRPAFTPGTPKLLFQGNYGIEHRGDVNYDISPDGRQFLMTRPVQSPGVELNVVLDWFTEIERRAPAKSN